MNKLLKVTESHLEVPEIVAKISKEITLRLQKYIEGLNPECRLSSMWEQFKDRILCRSPRNVYEEMGYKLGIAIVKLTMKGEISKDEFTSKEIVEKLEFDAGESVPNPPSPPQSLSPEVADHVQYLEANLESRLQRLERQMWTCSGALETKNIRNDLENLKARVINMDLGRTRGCSHLENGAAHHTPDLTEEFSSFHTTGDSAVEVENLRNELEEVKAKVSHLDSVRHSEQSDLGLNEVQCPSPSTGGVEFSTRSQNAIQNTCTETVETRYFENTQISFGSAVDGIRNLINHRFGQEKKLHRYRRFPSFLSRKLLGKRSIALGLRGGSKQNPESVTGSSILSYIRAHPDLSGISYKSICEEFSFPEPAVSSLKPQRGSSSEEDNAVSVSATDAQTALTKLNKRFPQVEEQLKHALERIEELELQVDDASSDDLSEVSYDPICQDFRRSVVSNLKDRRGNSQEEISAVKSRVPLNNLQRADIDESSVPVEELTKLKERFAQVEGQLMDTLERVEELKEQVEAPSPDQGEMTLGLANLQWDI